MTREITERQVIAALAELDTVRQAIAVSKRREEQLTALVKGYLQETGQESVHDGKHGITAKLQQRSGSPTYDVAVMPGSLVAKLALRGALKVDNQVVKSLKGKFIEFDDIERYAMPGKVTTALVLERKGA